VGQLKRKRKLPIKVLVLDSLVRSSAGRIEKIKAMKAHNKNGGK